MVFSSLYFLFTFLPVVVCIYFIVPVCLKNFVLLAASIFFYAWGEPVYVVLMLFSTVFNYLLGLDMGRSEGREKSRLLIFAVAVNLFILGFFKYYGFCVETINGIFHVEISYRELALPIGISFYTFQSLSYIIDVYYDRVKVQHDYLKFALYLTMFPQLIAGPIVQYSDIENQLEERKITLASFGRGVDRFILGLSRKVLLANNLGMIYTQVQALEQRSVLSVWIGIFAYTLQIYFDFSGYSDMAIGLGKMFGFTFLENFQYPYTAGSVTEFWRRWHISLSSWFRDYVYIPLGGNRVPRWKHVRNILIVWMLTGLWHGASWNFVAWGLYYGVLLLIEKYLLADRWEAVPQGFRRMITLLLVMIGWVFFSNTNISDALFYLGNLVGSGTDGMIDRSGLYSLRSNLMLLLLGWIMCGPSPDEWFRKLTERKPVQAVVVDTALFLICLAYLVYSSYNPFLYFRF